eukprot:scaffold225_cov194-Ochromonas_danica.AAC.5
MEQIHQGWKEDSEQMKALLESLLRKVKLYKSILRVSQEKDSIWKDQVFDIFPSLSGLLIGKVGREMEKVCQLLKVFLISLYLTLVGKPIVMVGKDKANVEDGLLTDTVLSLQCSYKHFAQDYRLKASILSTILEKWEKIDCNSAEELDASSLEDLIRQWESGEATLLNDRLLLLE